MGTTFVSGDWSICCARCNTTILASESRKEYDGLIVCKWCYEPRHPQEMIRMRKDRIIPPFIRPEREGTFPPAEFVGQCDKTSRADFAVCNCAVANVI